MNNVSTGSNGFLDVLAITIVTIPLLILISLLFTVPVWLAWNYVGPSIFSGPEISFLKMWCIVFLFNFVVSRFQK